MHYAELVMFVKWMEKHGKYKPFAWINPGDQDYCGECFMNFDGRIYPDDVERFNAEPAEEGR